MKKSTIFGLVVPILLSGPACAKRSISGQVVDRNGAPVDRVVVTIAPGDVQLVTDHEGRFFIEYLRDNEGERTKISARTDYTLEAFRPGYHTHQYTFYYKNGPAAIEPITLVEDTIRIQQTEENIDPELFDKQTHSSGANYEGQ